MGHLEHDENTRQRRAHHGAERGAHAHDRQQYDVVGRQWQHVGGSARHEHPGHRAEEQCRGKNTTATAGAVARRGREQFGREFVDFLLQRCGRARKEDIVATATALTSRSIGIAVRQVISSQDEKAAFREYLVSGGGARNRTLMSLIATELLPWRLKVRNTDEFGMPSDAKEAAAFAVLAYQTWLKLPSNVPSATGARRTAILGKITNA